MSFLDPSKGCRAPASLTLFFCRPSSASSTGSSVRTAVRLPLPSPSSSARPLTVTPPAALAENQHHQERIGQVIGELAKVRSLPAPPSLQPQKLFLTLHLRSQWVAEDRSLRDAQFHELIGAVHGVVKHVAELPQRMLASLGAAEAGADAELAQPTVDREHDGTLDPIALDGPSGAVVGVEPAPAPDGSRKKRTLGLNPLSSFAQLDRKMVHGEAAGVAGRVKGPRMPGIRLWGASRRLYSDSSLLLSRADSSFLRAGAPEPVADRVNRWGGAAVAAKASADELATEAALSADDKAARAPHGPVVDALKSDEKLGDALQAIADGTGDEVDAGAVSRASLSFSLRLKGMQLTQMHHAVAVFEILQTLRDLSTKQAQQEAQEQAERDKHGGLTLKEMAELEVKRAEIFRLEQETVMNSQRTASASITPRLLLLALSSRADECDFCPQRSTRWSPRSPPRPRRPTRSSPRSPRTSRRARRRRWTRRSRTRSSACSGASSSLYVPHCDLSLTHPSPCSGVRSGVDEHVKDFRGQLTSEVRLVPVAFPARGPSAP